MKKRTNFIVSLIMVMLASSAYAQSVSEKACYEYQKLLNLYDDIDKIEGREITRYFLYDITKDGIPELWVISDKYECAHGRGLTVYTYNHGLMSLYKDCSSSFHEYYGGNGYVMSAGKSICKLT